jgi:hypothetical protein
VSLVAVAEDPRSTWKPSLVIVLRLIGVLQKFPLKCWTRVIEHVSAMISGGLEDKKCWAGGYDNDDTKNRNIYFTCCCCIPVYSTLNPHGMTMMIVGPDALESHTTLHSQ